MAETAECRLRDDNIFSFSFEHLKHCSTRTFVSIPQEIVCSQIVQIRHGSHMFVESRLGSGTYGKVFAVRHIQTGHQYAMKVVPIKTEKHLRWARSEVKVLERIRDSGAYKCGLTLLKNALVHEGNFCLIMDRMQGDLWDCMRSRQGRPFELGVIRSIGNQLLAAVEKLHSLGIIHADVKPENILIASMTHGIINIQLSDFGSSVLISRVKNRQGDTLQSLFYRSPEVLYGMRYSEKIDIWSIGCVLAEMFIGYAFYPAADEIQLAYYISSTQGLPKLLTTSINWEKFFQPRTHFSTTEYYAATSTSYLTQKYPLVRPGIPDRRCRAFSGLNCIVHYGFNARYHGYVSSLDVQFTTDLHLLMNVDAECRCDSQQARNLPFFRTIASQEWPLYWTCH